MGLSNNQHPTSQQKDHNLIDTKLCRPRSSSPWFELRVFYVRFNNVEVEDSIPKQLTLIYVPLEHQTILKMNGERNSTCLDHVSSRLERDPIVRNYKEVTFVNTDSVGVMGSIGFEVLDGEDLLISGVLNLQNADGCIDHSSKKWTLKCQSHVVTTRYLNGRKRCCHLKEVATPLAEIYVAGCFHGSPVILSKTIDLLFSPRSERKSMLGAVSDQETSRARKGAQFDAFQDSLPEYTGCQNLDNDFGYRDCLSCYMEDENEELSWFNAGVRVGVGISLGICVGVGIGVGLLAKTYQATSSRFKKKIFFL